MRLPDRSRQAGPRQRIFAKRGRRWTARLMSAAAATAAMVFVLLATVQERRPPPCHGAAAEADLQRQLAEDDSGAAREAPFRLVEAGQVNVSRPGDADGVHTAERRCRARAEIGGRLRVIRFSVVESENAGNYRVVIESNREG